MTGRWVRKGRFTEPSEKRPAAGLGAQKQLLAGADRLKLFGPQTPTVVGNSENPGVFVLGIYL